MTLPLFADLAQAVFKLLLGGMAVFLILLVLVQRGRGGGLAGALGGMGGSSAFGAKAGDVFTRVTVVAASIWIVLCIVAANMAPSSESRLNTGFGAVPASSGPDLTAPATEEGTEETSETEAGDSSDTAEDSAAAVEEAAEGGTAAPEQP